MAITGGKFLSLSDATSFIISEHALKRLDEHTGMDPTKGLASVLFEHSQQVKADEMVLLGYRPRYGNRLKRGQKSWYFQFRVFCQELVAVIGEGDVRGEFVWVTTYSPNPQTEIFRLAEYENLVAA